MLLRAIQIAGVVVFLASCSDSGSKERKPIVLGDSSTIVTETNPALVSDFVSDIQLQQVPEDTVAASADTTSLKQQPAEAANDKSVPDAVPTTGEKGLSIPFSEVTVFIPGIQVKSFRQTDLKKANGVSYQLIDGSINNNQLRLSGASILKVSQRYMTGVLIKNELGSLTLDALSNTTAWAPLKGGNNVYGISGLDANRLTGKSVTPAQISSAVTRAARNKRLSKKDIRKWEASVRNIRAVNQKPFVLVLRSVMWKIDGKDAKGKSFSKQVRIDMPHL